MRVRRSFPFLAVLCFFSFAAPARPAEKTDARRPDIVVQIKPIDDLIADFKYVAGLAGKENETNQVDATLGAMLGEKHAGFDFKRPLGTYGFFGESLMDGSGCLLIPITSEKDVLSFIEDKLNQKPEKGDDGIYTLNLPTPPIPIYFRFHKGYAYVAAQTKGQLETDKLLDPEKVLPGKVPGFRTVIRLERIPDAAKQMALQAIDAQVAKLKEKEPPEETKVQREAREKGIDEMGKRLGLLVQEGGELRLTFDIDRQAGDIKAEADLSGKAGSSLAADIKQLGEATSLFGGVEKEESAARMIMHFVVPESLRQIFDPAVDEFLKKASEHAKDESKRATAKKVLEALAPTLKSGEVDTLFAVRGPGDDHHYTAVFGIKVKDGQQIDQTIRSLVQELPEADRKKIVFDAETAGDVKIHRADVQKDMDAHGREAFGDHPLYFAVSADRLVAGLGPQGLDAVKEALEAEAKPAPQFELDVAVAHLAPLMAEKHKNAVAAAKAAFGEDADKDAFHFRIQGGERFSIQLSVKARVITFGTKLDHGDKKSKDKEDDEDK